MQIMKPARRRKAASHPSVARALFIEEMESRLLMARLVGIDVSHYQGTVNWPTVAQHKDFAFIRATTGNSTFDTRFTANATQAVANGLYVGFYHYAYYDLAGHTPINEADHFWGVIKPYLLADGKHLMPVLDLERNDPPADGTTVDVWANAFNQRIQSRAQSELGLSITPIIYTGGSKAGTLFSDGSVPLNYPLWVAQWPNPIPDPQIAQPSGVGDWQSGTSPSYYRAWSFWQYAGDPAGGPSGSSPGVNGICDLDVFQGDELALQTYVIGSPGRWTANTRVQVNYNLNAWSQPNGTGTPTSVPAGTKGTIKLHPTVNKTHQYGNSFWRWYVEFDNGTKGWVGEYQTVHPTTGAVIDWLTTVTPTAPTNPAPANSTTTWLTSLPGNFTWAAGANATSYDVYVDGVKKANVLGTSWAPTGIADGNHTWRVDAVNAEKTTAGTTWNFKVDSGAPAATFGGQTPAHGTSTLTFTVTYSDAGTGVQYASLGNGDVLVTGPNGFSQLATLQSVDAAGDGATRVATYSVTAPGGTWDNSDLGSYTISQAASQVRDVAGNFRAAGTVGTFTLNFSPAYLAGSTLVVTYAAPGMTMRVSRIGTNVVVNDGATNYTFVAAGVGAVTVNTTAGNDALVLSGGMPAAISLVGPVGGNDVITLNSSASASIATDAEGFSITAGVAASLSLEAAVTRLASLTISGAYVSVASGATLAVGNLSIASDGMLDLNDASLVWNYAGATPVNTLRSYLQSGRDGGNWYGPGIQSSAAASDPSMALGYLEASDLGVTDFAGADVDETALLVKYTRTGDVNLDGVVDSADLSLMDRGFARQVSDPHWLDGDFDYDGALTPADYVLINRSLQPAAPAPAFSDAAIAAPVAVAEESTVVATKPVATLGQAKTVRKNKAVKFTLAATGSVGSRFTYRIDWDGDGVADRTFRGQPESVALTRKFAKAGRHRITFWAVDEATGLKSDVVRKWIKVL